MSRDLVSWRVIKATLEVFDLEPGQKKFKIVVQQKSEVAVGEADGIELVKATMSLDARAVAEHAEDQKLFVIHTELEAVFKESGAIDHQRIGQDKAFGREFADSYAQQMYPMGIMHLQRLLVEMGLGGIRIDLKYPQKAESVAPSSLTSA